MRCDMTSTKGNLRIMFVLFVHTVILTLCSCAAITTSQLSTRDDGADKLLLFSAPNPIWDRYTKNRIDWNTFTTKKPTDWSSFTTKRPTVWNRVTTKKPIDWNEFIEKLIDSNEVTEKPIEWNEFIEKLIDSNEVTEKPINWRRNTWKPIDWRFTMDPIVPIRFTVQPIHFKDKDRTNFPLLLFIGLPALLFVAFIFLCKYFVCPRENSTYESILTVHPPPTRIIPPSQNTTQNQTSSSQIRTTFAITRGNSRAFQGTNNYAFTRDDVEVPIRNNANDKPPDYSEVVISDLEGANAMKFPEVAPKIPDTPPPKYDEGNIWKY